MNSCSGSGNELELDKKYLFDYRLDCGLGLRYCRHTQKIRLCGILIFFDGVYVCCFFIVNIINMSCVDYNDDNVFRMERSLGLLTTKFVSLLLNSKDGVLDLNMVI